MSALADMACREQAIGEMWVAEKVKRYQKVERYQGLCFTGPLAPFPPPGDSWNKRGNKWKTVLCRYVKP